MALVGGPVWITGLGLGAIAVAFATGAVRVAARLEPADRRVAYNDIVGFVIAVVGTVYAVLLAWVAVAVWERHERATAIVEREASVVADLADLAAALGPAGAATRESARAYARAAAAEEWPAMAAGRAPEAAAPALDALRAAVVALAAAEGGGALPAALLGRLIDLLDARRDRLLAARAGLPGVIWAVLGLGAAGLVGLSALFGLAPGRHRLLSSALALSIALVLTMIVALDRPFRGSMGVDPDAFGRAAGPPDDAPAGKAAPVA